MEENTDKEQEGSINDSHKRAEDPSSFNPSLHNEARKLFQILEHKDHCVEEKDQNIQQYEEEVDNLRKNIIHLQTEFELLDHKYHAELSYREEVEKNNEFTRNLIDTVQDYAEILATSIKILDDDKFRITDLYNEIHREQEATEAKRKKLELTVKEQDEFIKDRVAHIHSERDELLERLQQLTAKRTDMKEKLSHEINQKNELEKKVEELKDKMSEMVAEANANKVIQSNLRNKLVMQKVKGGQMRKMEEKVYKKRIKLLNSKNRSLRENLKVSRQELIALKEDLELKYFEMQGELQEIHVNNSEEVKNLELKLSACLSENENLKNMCKKLESDLENINDENNKVNKEELESARSQLLEQEKELKRKIEECSEMKKKIEELNAESQDQAKMITQLQMKKQNDDELNRKISDLELKLQNCIQLEAELKSRIALQNESLSSERSGYERLISEQKSHITVLEENLARITVENKNNQYQLDESITRCNDLKNELEKRSAEIEKLKNKIIEMCDQRGILEGLKTCEYTIDGTTENIISCGPNTFRKLLSTPVRLIQSPGLPTVKTCTPKLKKLDPYNFDSDSSTECLSPGKTPKISKTDKKKGNSCSKRGK